MPLTMKRLNSEAFDRARQFLKTQARPLDRAMFEYLFETASAERVIAELARFQNEDGGFGRALEPDLRTPSSSALATEIGLRRLKELGCSTDHPMVRNAVLISPTKVMSGDSRDHGIELEQCKLESRIN